MFLISLSRDTIRDLKPVLLIGKKMTRLCLDIDHLKKPKSAYAFFGAEVRPELKEKYPDDSKRVTTELGVRWKALNEISKQKYVQMNLDDKDRYMREIDEIKSLLDRSKGC